MSMIVFFGLLLIMYMVLFIENMKLVVFLSIFVIIIIWLLAYNFKNTSTMNGIGTMMYGEETIENGRSIRSGKQITDTTVSGYITTIWLTIFAIPILPVKSIIITFQDFYHTSYDYDDLYEVEPYPYWIYLPHVLKYILIPISMITAFYLAYTYKYIISL